MRSQDPVGTALAGIGAGATTGAAVMTTGVLIVRLLQRTPDASPATGGAVLTATLAGGVVAAVISGWVVTASVADVWRRGVTAAIAVLGAALLAVGATVADQFTGVLGIGVWCLALGVAAVAFHASAHHVGRE